MRGSYILTHFDLAVKKLVDVPCSVVVLRYRVVIQDYVTWIRLLLLAHTSSTRWQLATAAHFIGIASFHAVHLSIDNYGQWYSWCHCLWFHGFVFGLCVWHHFSTHRVLVFCVYLWQKIAWRAFEYCYTTATQHELHQSIQLLQKRAHRSQA